MTRQSGAAVLATVDPLIRARLTDPGSAVAHVPARLRGDVDRLVQLGLISISSEMGDHLYVRLTSHGAQALAALDHAEQNLDLQ